MIDPDVVFRRACRRQDAVFVAIFAALGAYFVLNVTGAVSFIATVPLILVMVVGILLLLSAPDVMWRVEFKWFPPPGRFGWWAKPGSVPPWLFYDWQFDVGRLRINYYRSVDGLIEAINYYREVTHD